jgi:PilZ domain-containing protein
MGHERRKSRRRAVQQPAILVGEDGVILGKCLLLDVSESGAKLKRSAQIATLPAHFILVLSRDGQLRRYCQVAWQSGATIGVRFVAIEPAPGVTPGWQQHV